MKNELLAKLTKRCVCFFVILCIGSVLWDGLHLAKFFNLTESALITGKEENIELNKALFQKQMLQETSDKLKEKLGTMYFQIKINPENLVSFEVQDSCMSESVVLELVYKEKENLMPHNIYMYEEGKIFQVKKVSEKEKYELKEQEYIEEKINTAKSKKQECIEEKNEMPLEEQERIEEKSEMPLEEQERIEEKNEMPLEEQERIEVTNKTKAEKQEHIVEQTNVVGREQDCSIEHIELDFCEMSDETRKLQIKLDMQNIYAFEWYQEDEYLYIACKRPKDVYKNIVVLDAGHGGSDTGSYGISGDWVEKDYNLDFVAKVQEQFSKKNTKLYLTRSKDVHLSLNERVILANQVEADLFVSIHCNSTDEYEGSGLEALYKSDTYKNESQRIAMDCLERLESVTGLHNRGALDGQSIYIIRNANMPTVLFEMGFLSDENDIAYLKKEENREKMAECIVTSIKKGLEVIK